jgi:hypothetical protein
VDIGGGRIDLVPYNHLMLYGCGCGGRTDPVPNSNWLILRVFISARFFVMGKLLCNYGFYTSEAILNPYTTSMWILVVAHLVQLAYFGNFHLSTSFCTSGAILRPLNCFLGLPQ